MYHDDGYFDDFPIIQYKGLRDYHLRSALVHGNLKEGDFQPWEKKVIGEIRKLNENFNICERDPCSILGRVLEESRPIGLHGREFEYTGICLDVESRAYSSLKAPLLHNAAQILKNEKLLTKYYVPSQFFQSALVISNALNAQKELPRYVTRTNSDYALDIVTKHLESLRITLKICSECIGVILDNKRLSIHHIDQLRNWSDKCTERFNIEMACYFGNRLNPTIYPPLEKLIYKFWGIWDKPLRIHGNLIYKCVKIFEAMVIGIILKKNPNVVINPRSDFLENTVEDFVRGLEDSNQCLSEYTYAMRDFLLGIESMQYLSQLYGLYRTWGHPVVKPFAGIEKVYKLGIAEKTVSEVIPIQIRRVFMLRFAIWFKGVKGIYPSCQDFVEDVAGNPVREMLQSQCAASILEQTLNSPYWDFIRFKKCIEIPKTYNLSEMVADKAISPDRSGLFHLCNTRGGMYDANLRRGVLQWLIRDPESCEDFLRRVDAESLTDDELIIGLYQKEREVNETPRMFSLMSHSIRNYIVTTEAMLSSDILPAFPNITMTDTLLSLQKKIYSVSHRQSQNLCNKGFQIFRDITVIVNIDFEKWNLNFRRETTFPIFEAIGDLYGMENLYNRTYDIFEKSLIYLADGSWTIDTNLENRTFVLKPPLMYIGHKGGFEGLRQKGWTIFTDCGLDLICSRHKCSYTIMGQGDNQVLALTWRTYHLDADRSVNTLGKRILTRQFNAFMDDMISSFGELGLPVKALETWTSENLFLYGKFPTLRGVPLSMSLKKICRAYYLANEEIMTLDCSLATIQSNAMAACMSDVTSFVPYVVYKIQVMLAIKAFSDYHVLLAHGAFDYESGDSWKFTSSTGTKREYHIDRGLQSTKFWMILSWFPKILGGVSIASLYDFFMRGFPDRVSAHLTWVLHLRDASPDPITREVLRGIYQGHINPEKNFVLLIEDPCALNLIVPVDAKASVRQSVQELFENLSNVRNVEFASLFKFNKLWEKTEFCEELCRGDILHPRFLHDVAAATLGGYVDSVVSKVSKASTINKLALRSSKRNPGKHIEEAEGNYMKYLIWKLSPTNHHRSFVEHPCPTQQARELRIRSWDKQLEGVTVPHPMAFLKFHNCTQDPQSFNSCNGSFIMISLPESFCAGDLTTIHSLGGSPPYLGSETREKIGSDPSRQVFGKEPLIARPLRLLRVINWFVKPESYAEELIYSLLRAVSDLNPVDYVSREMGITGSEAHRYRDQALKHGVMSANMYTLGSHMHISTDTWIKYTRGAENYTINYQSILCSLQALVGGHLFKCHDEGITPPREYHFHESCDLCIQPLTEEFHDLSSNKIISMVPSSKENPYLWVQEAALSLKYKHDPQLAIQIPEVGNDEYHMLEDKRKILTNWVSEDIINDILSNASNSMGPRLLDSKDYPRVMYKKLSVKELWEETALGLISRAGIKYTSKDTTRVAYPDTARALAADDIMKCSSSSLMGLSMFYSWPDKFAEVERYDSGLVYPDSSPPTLSGSCVATQINMRKIIRSCSLNAPDLLILARTNRQPLLSIKSYWYRILCSEYEACPQCLKSVSDYESMENIRLATNLRCSLGHRVITARMLRIKTLTASEDKLLKDSMGYNEFIQVVNTLTEIPQCPTVLEFDSFFQAPQLVEDEGLLSIVPTKSLSWQYSAQLPTNSKCRTYEILSILRYQNFNIDSAHGIIFGDGLGTSSYLIAHFFPNTYWLAATLQDSERTIPQSYPHVMIPGNPSSSSQINVNYKISKILYNNALSDCFVTHWQPWIHGGFCWVEIETQVDRLIMLNNILILSDWEIVVIRTDFESFEEASEAVALMMSHSWNVRMFVTGSLNVEKLESVFVLQGSTKRCVRNIQSNKIAYAINYLTATEELFQLAESLNYAEYLASIEEQSELSRMYCRCDYWFAQIGVTNLLSCSKLFTPIWWDLQTGKLPSTIRDLGSNKTYFMYKSDLVAIQARLIALAISLLSRKEIYSYELKRFEYWKMEITNKGRFMHFKIVRSDTKINYGGDHLMLLKYIPTLRKLNFLHNRWWKFMPRVITFHTHMGSPGFWISRISQTLPHNLPNPT